MIRYRGSRGFHVALRAYQLWQSLERPLRVCSLFILEAGVDGGIRGLRLYRILRLSAGVGP